MLTLNEIKLQCRIDSDYVAEDGLLELLAKAAVAQVENFILRKLYATEVPDTDPDGLIFDDALKVAALMLVSHWYENRSTVSDFEQTEVPMAFYFLLQPYKSYRHMLL